MLTTPAKTTRVEDTAAMLAQEFNGIFSFETIKRTTEEAAGKFQGSRVIEFVPLLTYRSAREKLLAEARQQSDAAGSNGRVA